MIDILNVFEYSARIEYREYRDSGGELMWNEWRHEIWRK